ncbi:MAG: oligosaccharide flippase family protein [Oscillibacter sp.]|nr:oligosaccharide flippase family protein [Oscillibacter sp.]
MEDGRRRSVNGAAANFMLLTFVQAITMMMGIIVTKLLSAHFSLQEYGTYAQALLITNTATSLSILGLTDATNFFYNRTKDEKMRRVYIATIFSIQYVAGTACGLAIILFRERIMGYFGNSKLEYYLLIIAFTPLLNNLIAMYQTLFVSIGKAKIIAVKNLIVSVIRLITVLLSCYLFKDIIAVTFVILAMDICQAVYFYFLFQKHKAPIKIRDANAALIKEILVFSVPMSIVILTSSLSRDIDKYVISIFADTETLAIYTNAAKVPPFNILTSALVTVLMPIITKMLNQKQYSGVKSVFKLYLRIEFVLTLIFVGGAIAVSENLMRLLFDEKYLVGLPVFVVYLVIDIVQFANVTTLLSGAGKTKTLMWVSVTAMACNACFNVLGYKLWGLIGPAAVTLILTVFMAAALLHFGAKEVKARVIDLFDFKEIAVVGLEIAVVGPIAYWLSRCLGSMKVHYAVNLAICYGGYVVVLGALNYRRIFACYKELNQYK